MTIGGNNWVRRNPALAAFIGLVLCAVVAGSVIVRVNHKRLEKHDKELLDTRKRENFLQASRAVKEMAAEVGANDPFAISNLDNERQKLLEAALASARDFQHQDPDNPEVKRSVAQVWTDVADIYRVLGRSAAAEQLLVQAWRMHEDLAVRFPEDPSHRREQIDVDIKLANIRDGAGRRDEAEQIYRDIRVQARQLAEAHPDDADILSERAWVEVHHAWVLLNEPRHMSEGEREAIQARMWLEQTVSKKPKEKLHRERLAASWNDWGVFAGAQERLPEAREAYRRVVQIESGLLAEDSGNRSYTMLLGIASRNLARIDGRLVEILRREFEQASVIDAAAGTLNHAAERAELISDADEAFQQSATAFQKLMDQYAWVPQYRSSLAITLVDHGILMIKSGQTARGEELVESALAIHKQLAQGFPTVAHHKANAAEAYRLKAILSHKKGHLAEARQNYLEAIHWLQEAMEQDSAQVRYRKGLADAYWYCAGVDLELREPLRAANQALAMLHVYPEADYEFWTAELLARCIPLTQDAGLASMHANLCLELTRSWLLKSDKMSQEIRRNPHFAPLLKRNDFQRMLADVDLDYVRKGGW